MSGSKPAQPARFSQLKEAKERRLIEAAQEDRARFADLYENYFHMVYAYAARRTGDRAAAEDVTSEVFRKALANLKRFKWTGAPFGAWLLRIAANIIADRVKRSAREQDVDAANKTARGQSTGSTRTQQVSLEDAERAARLYQRVEELPDDQRRVVVMRFSEEKSIREIANQLNRSEGAVKQLQLRALQNLRTKLQSSE